MEPKELHEWYLEAVSRLNPHSFNQDANKPYEELTAEQKFIDKYISDKINAKVKEAIQKISKHPGKSTFTNRNWEVILKQELGL